MEKRLTLHIYGNVQGVNFRYYVWNFAKTHHIKGWIRNEKNGLVIVVSEGGEKNLRNLIDFCYNGIKSAHVDIIESEWNTAQGEYSDFTIKYGNIEI